MKPINELKDLPRDVNSPESQEILRNIRNNLLQAREKFNKFLENYKRKIYGY